MTGYTKPLLAALGFLALGACGDRTVFSSWHQEAGAFLDTGSFGNATMNNMMVQMCQSRIPKGRIIYEPRVVRAPAGSPAPYYRRAHCTGYLNGKYAEVIFREYVQSATEMPPSAETGLAAIAAQGG